MKECKWSKDGSKMLINSGWKEFDKQTNVIATGNVYATTQFSSFIRPWKETECNGFTNPEGHLMNFDMTPFRNHNIPKDIMDYLTDHNRQESVILYMFFILDKDKHVEPFSFVVTSYNRRLIMYRVRSWRGQRYIKRLNATKEAIKYITD